MSIKEQLAICVRFVDQSTLKIEERFMVFSECDTGVTGEAIADRLLSNLATWQLPASNMIGQIYGGAGAMAGGKKELLPALQSSIPRLSIPIVLLMPSTCV